MSIDELEKSIAENTLDNRSQSETTAFVLACVNDFTTDGLAQDYLWSLLFQFLQLSPDVVKQAAVDAQWEWSK